jgi:hypothetical protein
MDDEPTHLSSNEVRRALDRLRSTDIVRLSELSRNWASGLRAHDADDLLNVAFDRVLYRDSRADYTAWLLQRILEDRAESAPAPKPEDDVDE